MSRRLLALIALIAAVAAACSRAAGETTPGTDGTQPAPTASVLEPTTLASSTTMATTTIPTTTTTPPPATTTTVPTSTLQGKVFGQGWPLIDTTVEIEGETVRTEWDGSFRLDGVTAGTVTVSRPAWHTTEIEWDGTPAPLDIELEPRIVRALRVSRYVASMPEEFEALLDLAERTAINTLVFDTKDETGRVLYETQVSLANEMDAVAVKYDPNELVPMAKARDFYTITRIVTFEDDVWSVRRPEGKLAGIWMDPRNRDNWEYPLGLATEACELGFDEIQFDYVRFPSGRTASIARQTNPTEPAERVEAIRSFLEEARNRLHPMGCALSAAIFAIVVSSPDEQGIGQRPEELSTVVDAISPMIYPSHYSDGWLGFAKPNDHPGPVTARALDDGTPRLAPGTLMRPWLQAFYYTGEQVLAGIEEAETRSLGWILWNAGGNYAESWLPGIDDVE